MELEKDEGEKKLTNESKFKKFREYINSDKILVAPGAYDALTAKIIEQLGFDVVYFSGGSVSISLLGYPDIGLISFGEMMDQLRNIVRAVDVPVFADGDNGYGNAINVRRTVQEYESAGVAGIQLDDLNLPKKYAEPSKQILSIEEVRGKIQAASDARQNKDFVIIFRTLARLDHGIDEAILRSKAALEAGADLIFIDGLESEEEFKKIKEEIDGQLLINMNEKGFAANFSLEYMENLGFNIALFPVSSIVAAAKGVKDVLGELKKNGSTKNTRDKMLEPIELYNFVGLEDYKEIEKKYLPSK